MNSGLPWSARRTESGNTGEYAHPARQPAHDGVAESSALHEKLNELSSQLSAMVGDDTGTSHDHMFSQTDPGVERHQEPSMKTLIDRIETNERSANDSMSQLNSRLAALADKLDRDEPDQGQSGSQRSKPALSFDAAMQNVMAHVEQSEEKNRKTMKALQDRIAEIGAKAAASANETVKESAAPIEDLERRLANIAAKLDRQESAPKKDPRIEALEQRLAELAEAIPEPGASFSPITANGPSDDDSASHGTRANIPTPMGPTKAELDALERRLDNLADEVRATGTKSPSQDDVTRLWTDQSALTEQVRQLKASAASDRDLQSMRASMDQLVKQVAGYDDSAQFDQVHNRVNELALRLENTLSNGSDVAKTSELESKIMQLDARLSAAQAQPENAMAVKALEAQVKQIADRLTDHERRLDTVTQLEASIVQLTSRLQTTRNEATASAEQAAMRMADQLRTEVDVKVNTQPAGDPAAELHALQQGLNAVQSKANTSDQRTHETLIAVHDTLDSVIERMNQIEAAKAAVALDAGNTASLGAEENQAKAQPAAQSIPTQTDHPDPSPAMATPVPQPETAQFARGPQISPTQNPVLPEAPQHGAPVGAQQIASARHDFIAAAREAARAAGHGLDPVGVHEANPAFQAPQAPHLGGQSAVAPANVPTESKRRQLLLAGTMALLIGAVAAYGLLNGYSGSSGSQKNPRFSRSAPAVSSGAVRTIAPAANPTPPAARQPIQQAPASSGSAPSNTANQPSNPGVQPAESVPFDPTAPQKSGNLEGIIPAPVDSVQTASISNTAGKTDAPRPIVGGTTLDRMVPGSPTSTLKSNPVLDPNLTAIGNPTNADNGSTIGALNQLAQHGSGSATVDPFVTGSISRAEPDNARNGDTLTSAELKAFAALPKALGPENMLRAAVKGDKVAQFMVATRYSNGKVVRKNFDHAATWYHKAASKGLAPAQYRLGTLYERGRGVTKSLDNAKAWYEHAAHRGHIKAMHNLAVLHANGAGGKAKFNQASFWFKKAANLGLKDSQFNLAILYQQGLGVPKDLIEAYRWYTLAAKQNDKDATKRLAKVTSGLSQADLAKAKQLVETWRPIKAKFAANVVTPPIGGWQASPEANAQAISQGTSAFAPGRAIRETQQLLNAIGYDAGAPDGKMGPRTVSAIKQFQSHQGRQPTGQVTPDLLQQLRNLPG